MVSVPLKRIAIFFIIYAGGGKKGMNNNSPINHLLCKRVAFPTREIEFFRMSSGRGKGPLFTFDTRQSQWIGSIVFNISTFIIDRKRMCVKSIIVYL